MDPRTGLEGTESKGDKRRILAQRMKSTDPRQVRVEVTDMEQFKMKVAANGWVILAPSESVILINNITEGILDDLEADDNVVDFCEIYGRKFEFV